MKVVWIVLCVMVVSFVTPVVIGGATVLTASDAANAISTQFRIQGPSDPTSSATTSSTVALSDATVAIRFNCDAFNTVEHMYILTAQVSFTKMVDGVTGSNVTVTVYSALPSGSSLASDAVFSGDILALGVVDALPGLTRVTSAMTTGMTIDTSALLAAAHGSLPFPRPNGFVVRVACDGCTANSETNKVTIDGASSNLDPRLELEYYLTCPPLSIPNAAELVPSVYAGRNTAPHGESVTVTCSPGYVLQGAPGNLLSCGSAGTWSPDPALVSCVSLPSPPPPPLPPPTLPSPPPPPSTSGDGIVVTPPTSDSGPNVGVLVAAVVSATLVLCVCLAAAAWLWWRRSRSLPESGQQRPQPVTKDAGVELMTPVFTSMGVLATDIPNEHLNDATYMSKIACQSNAFTYTSPVPEFAPGLGYEHAFFAHFPAHLADSIRELGKRTVSSMVLSQLQQWILANGSRCELSFVQPESSKAHEDVDVDAVIHLENRLVLAKTADEFCEVLKDELLVTVSTVLFRLYDAPHRTLVSEQLANTFLEALSIEDPATQLLALHLTFKLHPKARLQRIEQLFMFLADLAEASPYAQASSLGVTFGRVLFPSLPKRAGATIMSTTILNIEVVFAPDLETENHDDGRARTLQLVDML